MKLVEDSVVFHAHFLGSIFLAEQRFLPPEKKLVAQ